MGRGEGGGHLLFMSCCSRSRSRSSPGAWLWRRRSSGDGSPQGLPCSHSLAASNHHTNSNQIKPYSYSTLNAKNKMCHKVLDKKIKT